MGRFLNVAVSVFLFICSDIQRVLRDDREKLRLLQKSQPSFSEEQKKELMEVHTWIKRGGLPKEIDIKVEFILYSPALNVENMGFWQDVG